MPRSNDADRALAASILGCATWEDATDYRNTGAQDRRATEVLELVTAHRLCAVPETLDAALVDILGTPNFSAGPIAHVYQEIGEFIGADGEPLAKRAEPEQAFIILKLLRIWLEHGADWKPVAAKEFERAVFKANRKAGK